MSIEYTVWCDGCSRIIDASGRSATDARASVREMGGKTRLPGGTDLCPQCVSETVPVNTASMR